MSEEENKNQVVNTEQVNVGLGNDGEGKENKKLYLWLGLALVLLLLTGFFFWQENSRSLEREKPVVAPTVTIQPSPSSVEGQKLSTDDSLGTLEKELDQTPTDDFSKDLEGIQKDINSL